VIAMSNQFYHTFWFILNRIEAQQTYDAVCPGRSDADELNRLISLDIPELSLRLLI
jgi:hypothetical protein